ncbi:MAG TPA: acyl carrier protein [Anaerolineae bacterium]|nr:acyl carrier protein [Anaerolineae bacterium]
MASDTETKVREIVAEQFGLAPAEIFPAMDFKADLEADSLDCMELLMEIEDTFDISIADEDAEQIKTVADVIAYVAEARER